MTDIVAEIRAELLAAPTNLCVKTEFVRCACHDCRYARLEVLVTRAADEIEYLQAQLNRVLRQSDVLLNEIESLSLQLDNKRYWVKPDDVVARLNKVRLIVSQPYKRPMCDYEDGVNEGLARVRAALEEADPSGEVTR